MKSLRECLASTLRRWRSGIVHSGAGVIAALVGNVAPTDDTADLIMNRDAIIVDLYRQAAEIEGLSLRHFLLRYGLADVRPKR